MTTNPYAFPSDYEVAQCRGMSLRDYFAAHIASSFVYASASADKIAAWSYEVADAMLKAREQEPTP